MCRVSLGKPNAGVRLITNGFPGAGGLWAYRLTVAQRAILGALADTAPRTTADIADDLGKTPPVLRRSLASLLAEKLIASVDGKWFITSDGTKALTILAAAGEETLK